MAFSDNATRSLLLLMLPFASGASVIPQNVQYPDGSIQLSGFMATPSGVGPFPVVLHVHGIGGLTDFHRSRANRTAAELGYIGFAVSVFDEAEMASALAPTGGWSPGGTTSLLGEKYQGQGGPELVVSRLAAAVDFIKKQANVDTNKIAAVGYCFGGTAVLNFARLGGSSDAGVSGVVSFHGGLSTMGVSAEKTTWKSTRVLILNGAADWMIPKKDYDPVEASMNAAGVKWEFTNYGHAEHGFTHPKDGTGHYHYDSIAEERSWSSMSDFLGNSLGFKVAVPAAEELHTEEVTYMDGNVKLTGHIAYRANAKGPLPVVLHVHAWGGLSDFEKARANRTAAELGYIGFAVSIYDQEELAKASNAAGNFQVLAPISSKYSNSPELIVSRLRAAAAFVKNHAKADANNIAAVGYCFGGGAVLQFARLGGAESSGVGSVASFHGGLAGIANKESNFCPTRVAVYNGANDDMISDSELVALQAALETTKTYWELTNYSFAGHGFTHPTEASNDHFHFDKTAESRSWMSMAHFLKDSFMGKGKANSSTCTKFVPAPAQGGCQDDDAAVEAKGGAFGVKKCAANLCEGQFKDTMAPLCRKTCGTCPTNTGGMSTAAPTTAAPGQGGCQDDDAAVEAQAGAYGIKKCAANLCEGQFKDTMASLCRKTCGMCSTETGGMSTAAMTAAPTTAAPMTAAPTTAAPTTAAPKTVSVEFTVASLDYDKVIASASAKAALIKDITDAFLAQHSGYVAADVEVTLSKGSVKALVSVTPKAGEDSATLKSAMASTTDAIELAVFTSVGQMIAGDPTLLESGKTALDVKVTGTAPMETGSSAATPRPGSTVTSDSSAMVLFTSMIASAFAMSL